MMLWLLALAVLFHTGETGATSNGETATITTSTQLQQLRGGSLILTCKYTTAGNLGVVWKHKGLDFTANQNKKVTDGTPDGTLSVKLYTVTNALATTDAGTYSCVATYSEMATPDAPITVKVSDAIISSSSLSPELSLGDSLAITCKYTTENNAAFAWKYNGKAFTADQTSKVTDGAADGALSVKLYTVPSVATLDAGIYTCDATYPAGVVTSADVITVQILGVQMTISSASAAEGGKVTITCNYEQYKTIPTITWFKDEQAFTSDQNAATSDGDNCGDTQRHRYIITSASTADTGSYKCKASYGGKVLEPKSNIKFYVRKITTTSTVYHVEATGSIMITCTVNGDEPDLFKWYDVSGNELAAESFTITVNTYKDFEKTAILALKSGATEANHERWYKCKASWDANTKPPTLETTVELKVYDVTGISDKNEVTAAAGSGFTITCEYESQGATKVNWYRSDKLLTSVDPTAPLSYKIDSVAATDSGTYSCSVAYTGVTNPISGQQTKSLKVRGVTADGTTYSSDGSVSVILTCTFYGDEMNTASWYKAGSSSALIDVVGKTVVVAGTYSGTSNSLTTTLEIKSIASSDGSAYTCKTTYKNGNVETSSVQTLSILLNSGITSSGVTVTSGASVTLTCTHSAAPSGVTAAVEWKKAGIVEPLSKGVATASATTSTYTVDTASPSDSGQYSCKVSYGNAYTDLSSGQFEQFVRDIAAGAPATYSVDGDSAATLTCLFRGDALGLTVWTKANTAGDLANGNEYAITAGNYANYLRTDELEVKRMVAGDAGAYTCTASYVTGSVATSVSQTLHVLGVSSLSSTDDKIDAGSSFTLTCTYSTLSNGVEVSWTRYTQAITAGITPDGDTKSVLTVTSAKKEDNGNYKCTVKFGNYGTAFKEISQYVRFAEAAPVNYAINGAATHDITCTFYGDSLTATVWTFGGSTLSDDADYDIGTTSPTTFSRVDVLTINTVETSNGGTYKCAAQYSDGNAQTSKEPLLTIFAISAFVSSGNTVDTGSSFTLTCDYSSLSSGTPAVEWFKDNKVFTTGVTAPSVTRSVFTVSAASKNDNGVYLCKVTFGVYGTVTSSPATQYVRYVTPSATVYGVLQGNIDISCTFYGDALGATSWYKDGSSAALTTGGQYTVTAGTYQSLQRTDKLTINILTTGNAGAYTCKASYTSGISKELTSTQTLAVASETLSVAVTRTPSDSFVSDTTPVTFTCTYTSKQMGSNDGSITVAWTLNGKSLQITPLSNIPPKQTFKITSDYSNNGEYKCVVTYGVFGDISGSNTLLVQSVQHTANVYSLYGAAVTLTCKVYGDAPTTVTWTSGASTYTKTDAEVTDSAHNDYVTKSVFTIASVTSTSDIKCSAVYSGGNTLVQTTKVNVLGQISTPTITTLDATPSAKSSVTIACGFTAFADMVSKATIELFKVGTDIAVLTADVTDKTQVKHDFTMSNVDTTKTGNYNCKVTYGLYDSKTSANLPLHVRAHSADATHVVISGTAAVLSCKFEGDEVGSHSWHVSGSVVPLVDGATYEIPTATWQSSSSSLATTLTVKSATADVVYICKGTYTTGSKVVQTTHTVTVLGVAVSSSASTIGSGNALTLTCSHSPYAAGKITIDWSKNGKSITNDVELTIEQITDQPKSVVKFTAEQATFENNGVYKCKVTFGVVGSHEDELTQYILSGSASVSKSYSAPGATVTLTCVFYGSLSTATSWYKGSSKSAISTDSSYTVSAGTKVNFKRTDKLTLNSVDALDSAKYKCDNGDSPATQDLNIINMKANPSNAVAEVMKTTTMSCVTSETLLEITEIFWYKAISAQTKVKVEGGIQLTSVAGVNSGFKVYTSTVTITGETNVESATYSCEVQLPGETTTKITSSPATFYRIGVVSSEVTGYSGEYIESNQKDGDLSEQYTITFKVYKGPGVVSATLKLEGNVDTLSATKEAEVNQIIPYTYTPPYAQQKSGTFTLDVIYTGFPGKTIAASQDVHIYRYCETSTLPTVADGTWSPAAKVEYKGYATLTCSDGFFSIGSITQCGYKGVFLKTTEPSCIAKSSVICGTIPTTANGYAEYTGPSSVKYVCKYGYTLQGEDKTYSCDSTTKKWSIVTALNPAGDPPKCEESAVATTRLKTFTAAFPSETEYCKDANEDSKVKTALANFLKSPVLCLERNWCEITGFDCTWANKVLTVTFSLKQTYKLSDHTILSDAATAVTTSQISLNVDNSRRRKRALSLVSDSVTSKTVISCATGFIAVNGACVQCPVGYGLSNGACMACPLGYYSTEKSIAACTQCSISYTTMSTGSTSADACKASSTLCTVPAAPAYTGLVPPPGTLVSSGGTVSVLCASGHALEGSVASEFTCSGSPISPTCYRQCDLSVYDAVSVEELNMMWSSFGNAKTLVHDEVLNVTCANGYETRCKKSYDLYRCIGNNGADGAKITITSCSKKPVNSLLILGLCLGAVIAILIIILVWSRLSKKGKVQKSRAARGDNPAQASTKL